MTRRGWWLFGLAVALLVVIVLGPLASSAPDGLERVALDAGFAGQGQDATFELLPGYTVPGLGDSDASLVVAGLVGVVVLFGSMWLLGRYLARRSRVGG
jgi:hypothetical protein